MTAPRTFRKKPVEIQAVQFTDFDSYFAIVAWWKTWKTETLDATEKFEFRAGAVPLMLVNTLEGWMTASPGDWIIRGVKGEVYPCKPDIFKATYIDGDEIHADVVAQLAARQLDEFADCDLRNGADQ